jgi:hypothetical protein
MFRSSRGWIAVHREVHQRFADSAWLEEVGFGWITRHEAHQRLADSAWLACRHVARRRRALGLVGDGALGDRQCFWPSFDLRFVIVRGFARKFMKLRWGADGGQGIAPAVGAQVLHSAENPARPGRFEPPGEPRRCRWPERLTHKSRSPRATEARPRTGRVTMRVWTELRG